MHRLVSRAIPSLALAALAAALLAPQATATAPTRSTTTGSGPNAAESSRASAICGFAVSASLEVRTTTLRFSASGSNRVKELYSYRWQGTYTRAGQTVRLTQAGTVRIYLKDGKRYYAVAGRSIVPDENIGLVVYDLGTGATVAMHGREATFRELVCTQLTGSRGASDGASGGGGSVGPAGQGDGRAVGRTAERVSERSLDVHGHAGGEAERSSAAHAAD